VPEEGSSFFPRRTVFVLFLCALSPTLSEARHRLSKDSFQSLSVCITSIGSLPSQFLPLERSVRIA